MSGIVRSITHWTGGAGRASAKDKQHYHTITELDGNIVAGNEAIEDNVVTSDGDYAAHTLRLNTGSAGKAMAGMHGAVEVPYKPGPYPINEIQFEAHCRHLAKFHMDYGILPITRKNCITHAEVEPTLGVKQRGKWDLTRLPFKPELRGAITVGDYMRARVNAYLGAVPTPAFANRPILRVGDRGAFVLDAQSLLKSAGHFPGKLDGAFGPRTKAAVLAFQDAAGLVIDGVIGTQTWLSLMEAEEPAPREVTEADLREAGSETIKAADKGQKVTAAGIGATLGGVGLESVTGATQALTEATTALDLAKALLAEYWPLLIVLGAGIAALVYFQHIKKRRVSDAQTGKHLGR